MEKIRVAVLYGGRSGEHEVSLNSAANIIRNLDRSRFEVVPIGIDKDGVWFLGNETLQKELNDSGVLRLSREAECVFFNPDALSKAMQAVQPTQLLSQNKKTGRIFDVIFPVIHGTLCEDGTVQGLLELAEVPYVGCSVLASAVGMDKDVSKRLIRDAGIPVAPYRIINSGQWEKNAAAFCKEVIKELGFPLFVKPVNTGSSVGVNKVKRAEELIPAIEDSFKYDTRIIIEKGIDAVELEVGILESHDYGSEPIASVVGEIRYTHEFYSYVAKYIDTTGVDVFLPASIDSDLQRRVQEVAKNIFTLLECEGMARVDLFLERGTNKIYFNEVNTIPGFTQYSLYPKLMMASGVSYPNLLTHLIELAIARHERKSKLCREYVA